MFDRGLFTGLRRLAFLAVSVCLAANAADAQSLFSYPAPVGILSAVAGPDGNMWIVGQASPLSRITPDGLVTSYDLGDIDFGYPTAIIVGPDGNLWLNAPATKKIARITTAVAITEYPIDAAIQAMAGGPDGNIWFTATQGDVSNIAGKVTPDGQVTLYSLGTSTILELGPIATGPDGNLWVVENHVPAIAKLSTAGKILAQYSLPSTVPSGGLTLGPDGNLWFAEQSAGAIGRITPSGTITQFSNGIHAPSIAGITLGPDGNLWFNEGAAAIGRITPQGTVTEFKNYIPDGKFPIPDLKTGSASIAGGPNGTIWFDALYNYDDAPFYEKLVLPQYSPLGASILPGSRTVVLGTPATVFASMVNGGAGALTNCGIALRAGAPSGLQLTYQTTDPATNAPVGQPNQPVAIPSGNGVQSFVLTFVNPQPIYTGEVPLMPLNFSCDGASAPILPGLNTVDLFFSSSNSARAPDYIMVAASATPGLLNVPVNGAAAFGVAVANAGGANQIGSPATISTNTGIAQLPLSITLCLTNPTTGACLQPPSATATWNPAAGATATLSVFVTATGAVPLDPALNRIFVDVDYLGGPQVAQGLTSIAVAAQ